MNAAAPIVVEFAFNEFATVSGTLVTAAPDALTVEFAPDVWEQIDLLQLFHLRWDVRGDGSVSGTGPVQIELRLDPALAATRDPGDLGEVVAAATDESPLRQQVSWYARSVTEAVDLPPDLAEMGEVRAGFATTWGDPAT